MRRLAYLVVSGLVLAGPAWAGEAGDLLAKVKPECSKPLAELSVPQIEECRYLLRILENFVRAAHQAAEARGLEVAPVGK